MGRATSLAEILSAATCIVGMGNTFRNDDAAGVIVAERLRDEVGLSHRHTVMNVEDILESYVFQIAEGVWDNILLVDAVECAGTQAGSIMVGKLDDFEELGTSISTHKLSLAASARIFEKYGKATYLLGIVAGNIDYGTEVSDVVRASANKVVDLIRAAGS